MLLLFDLDGTLFQAHKTALFAAEAVYEELGLAPADDALIIQNIGRPMDVFLRNILPESISPDDVRDRFRKYERRAVRERGELFPGIGNVLRQLRDAGHILAVCSNGSPDYIGLVLQSTGIRDFFGHIYSAAKHASKADFVSELLAPGEDAVFIGDSYDDIEAGLRNGIPSVAALYGYGDKKRMLGATLTAQTAEELGSSIQRLEVFAKITEKLVRAEKRLIGINGIDTSGKTRFSEDYARYLSHLGYKTAVIHMDDFHNPLAVRRSCLSELDAYYSNAFNYRQLVGEVLEPLKREGCINKDVLCLNIDTDRYENTVHYSADDDTVVLLEGVLLFRPPISDYLEGRIYLHIDFEEVLKRAEARDVPKYGKAFLQKYIDKYIPVQKRYLEEFAPHLNCDVFVDNNDFSYPAVR